MNTGIFKPLWKKEFEMREIFKNDESHDSLPLIARLVDECNRGFTSRFINGKIMAEGVLLPFNLMLFSQFARNSIKPSRLNEPRKVLILNSLLPKYK
ncbi:hypothetical protein BpHYR1_049039 [Brachionus plicatilis]|uniref:Uncharacterized protein n=1 Tax=Brachionus plicatilis TaxID=10195 RepID=A0A3M7S5Z4_BRAPC|nr:hypothetical protein BpHYR1_049039 [Brachionus plicatilis]